MLALAAGAVLACLTTFDEPTRVLNQAELAAINASPKITEVHGTGVRTLHVFESVDCKFCRKIEPELAGLENVTIYRHLLPGHGAAARATTLQVICARDPVLAWRKAVQGEPVVGAVCASDALERNHSVGKRLGIERTPAMVFASGRVMTGLMTSTTISEALNGR